MGKIKPGNVAPRPGGIPSPPVPSEQIGIKFSFKYIHFTNPKFSLSRCKKEGYLEKLLLRLQNVSGLTLMEFRSTQARALRSHLVRWEDTSEKNGFSFLNEQLQGADPWQFQLSSNEHGRVHGFFIDDTFFIVWLDPDHQLYP